MFKKTLFIYSVSALIFSPLSYAAKLTIVNENRKALDVKIEPDGENAITSRQRISPERESTLEITSAHLRGKSHFSLKGDTNPFTPGGTCQHLSVEKDYKITFLDDNIGTTCLAEEIIK